MDLLFLFFLIVLRIRTEWHFAFGYLA